MIADGVHLQALPLERLGYYGCREKRLPVAVRNCFLEGEDGYDDDFYKDEAYKMAARKEAQLRIRTRYRRIPCWAHRRNRRSSSRTRRGRTSTGISARRASCRYRTAERGSFAQPLS